MLAVDEVESERGQVRENNCCISILRFRAPGFLSVFYIEGVSLSVKIDRLYLQLIVREGKHGTAKKS